MSEFEFFRPCADAMINLIVKKSVSEKNVSDKKMDTNCYGKAPLPTGRRSPLRPAGDSPVRATKTSLPVRV